ncbi:MAG TPA: hydrogen peroxide-dependent heme synthase [Longimicrobiaceae bacterium]
MPSAISPATVEGWYALHQVFGVDWGAVRSGDPRVGSALDEVDAFFAPPAEDGAGWSLAARLVGGGADLLFVHFRPDLESLADLQLRLRRSVLGSLLHLRYDFLSITEAGLYHATASVAAEHDPGTEEYERALAERVRAEAESAHVKTRLFPRVPEGMRYLTFYPMNKRREGEDNWYTLPVDARNRMMREHGLTGRRYAGRIFQVITGSVGLDDWEWGVTLFARDPLDFKRIVTDMRYDEVSARYGEFGSFFTGIRMEAGDWRRLLGPE